MKKISLLLLGLVLSFIVGFVVRGIVISEEPIKEVASSNQPRWTPEEYQNILSTQQNLRKQYDSCMYELDSPLDIRLNSCITSVSASEEYELLRKNYGEESIPEFLKQI